MAVPDFQSLMRPTLAILADGEARSQNELRDLLADTMNVTPEEREQLLPSGKQPLFANRVGWAITYLVKTGLLARPTRGYAQITERGRKVLGEYPDRVDMAVLSQFPEFAEFRTPHPVAKLQEQTTLIEKAELSPTESVACSGRRSQQHSRRRTVVAGPRSATDLLGTPRPPAAEQDGVRRLGVHNRAYGWTWR
jgi:restriction system protein